MKKLKILIPLSSNPHEVSQVSMLYKNLFEEFRKNIEIEIVWFLFMSKKLVLTDKKDFESFIQIQEYSNAIKILNEIKPDLIFATPSWNLIDYAFVIAAKNKKIPVISGTGQDFTEKLWLNSILKTLTSSFNLQDKKSGKPFSRLMFLIKKILFLIRTQRKLNLKNYEIIKSFFQLCMQYKSKIFLLYNTKYSTDLCWASGKINYDALIKAGYKNNQIILSGNPVYDKLFLNESKTKKNSNNKIRILFAAHPLYEHGYWPKKKQDETIIKIISELNKKQSKFEIIVKIHPTSSIKEVYSNLINKINPKIKIFQEGSIEKFFNNADVIVSYDNSSVNIIGFLSNIPSTVCNFYGESNPMHTKYGITDECSNISDLSNQIINTVEKGIDRKKYDKFIEDLFYKDDGYASKRIFDAIMKLLAKTPNE